MINSTKTTISYNPPINTHILNNTYNKPHVTRRLKGKSKSQKRKIRKRLNCNNNVKNNNIVINLSDKILTNSQITVLNKGLGFVPNNNIITIDQLNKDISTFERRLQLHYFFKSKNNPEDDTPLEFIRPTILSTNSDWWPRKLNPHITEFCLEVKHLINKTLHNKRNNNLSHTELLALKELKRDKTIIIKRCDKGGGIAIMNTINYKSKILTMLNDPQVYTKLIEDDTVTIKTKIDDLFKQLNNNNKITNKQLNYLTNFIPTCPLFYGLPKVHKNNWPLRPIVSQINGPTCKLSEFLDKHLTIAESKIPFLLKDTTAFLNLITHNSHCTDNTFLVSMDVTSLYTNIPHEQGADFVSTFYVETLNSWTENEPLVPLNKTEIYLLILFVLQNCTFQFDNLLFKQNYGTTMGSKFSVKFANIYMHMWFRNYLRHYSNPLPNFIARFIDDCFFPWSNTESQLLDFFTYINSCHPTIKFETIHSKSQINFLDTTTYIENHIIKTKLYKKPTDKKQYLHYKSCHPTHIKKSIPYSQALRYKRIILDQDILNQELNNLKLNFISRKYPEKLIDTQINKIKDIDREGLLIYQTTEHKKSKFLAYLKGRSFLPLITNYNDHIGKNKFKKEFETAWINFTQSTPLNSLVFNNEFPQLVFKRGKTIGNHLISTKFNDNSDIDSETINILASLLNENTYTSYTSSKCNHPRCLCCDSILESTSFQDTTKLNTFYINNNFNCNSTNILYYITCLKCNKAYVGQTANKLKDRLNNHRSNITLNKPTTIAIHFNEPRHNISDLRIMPILDLTPYNDLDRLEIEKSYMKKLHTIHPHGLNYYPINTN